MARRGQGFPGYPNLNDDVWLWGGSLDEIRTTITHGIRSEGDKATRFSMMPAYGRDGILSSDQINDLVDYVLHLAGEEANAEAVERAAPVFAMQCAMCHRPDGTGERLQGAPNLTDAEWLFGGDRETIRTTIYESRFGVMPHWEQRLDEATIAALAVYVHALGGGE